MTETLAELTAFQRDILYVVCDLDTPYGLGIKQALEEYYGSDINTGRVYQNLSKLVSQGYLNKSAIDNRTNAYRPTAKAHNAINHRHQWIESQTGSGVSAES